MRRRTVPVAALLLALTAAGGLPATAAGTGQVVARTGQVISGARISNPAGPCVVVPAGVTDVVVRDSVIGPCGGGVDGVGIHVFPGATRITMTGNRIHGVSSGVHVYGALHPILFARNVVTDVRGPYPRGQMIQFDQVAGGAGQSRIVGNVSDKAAATGPTRYEDHVSLYKSSGTAALPIVIACNRLRGGDSPTGSGIMVGDNGGGYVVVRDNTVVRTPNTGIGIAGGHDVRVLRNRVWNRGETVATMTQQAMTIFSYAGNTPRAITLLDNRGVANYWQYGGVGQLSVGYWDDGTVVGLDSRRNRWVDTTLTPAIWDTTPAACTA